MTVTAVLVCKKKKTLRGCDRRGGKLLCMFLHRILSCTGHAAYVPPRGFSGRGRLPASLWTRLSRKGAASPPPCRIKYSAVG